MQAKCKWLDISDIRMQCRTRMLSTTVSRYARFRRVCGPMLTQIEGYSINYK